MLTNAVTHPNHSKYHDAAMFHEAGYDSLLTATILLRLSAKMNTDSKSTGFNKPQSSLLPSPDHAPPQHPEILAVKSKASRKGKKGKAKPNNEATVQKVQSRFQSLNTFSHLSLLDSQEASSPSDDDQGGVAVGIPEATPSWQDEVYEPDTSGWVPIEQRQRDPMEMIPAWGTEFWQAFGNTLRVYGTEEAVLKIAGWDA